MQPSRNTGAVFGGGLDAPHRTGTVGKIEALKKCFGNVSGARPRSRGHAACPEMRARARGIRWVLGRERPALPRRCRTDEACRRHRHWTRQRVIVYRRAGICSPHHHHHHQQKQRQHHPRLGLALHQVASSRRPRQWEGLVLVLTHRVPHQAHQFCSLLQWCWRSAVCPPRWRTGARGPCWVGRCVTRPASAAAADARRVATSATWQEAAQIQRQVAVGRLAPAAAMGSSQEDGRGHRR